MMEKIEPKERTVIGFIVEEKRDGEDWRFHCGMFNTIEEVERERDHILKYWPDRKLRIVRVTTTYEVMEETE